MIRILLINGDKNYYLNVKEGTNFPLNFGISEIRDISTRKGAFSKTITIVGDKNNNIVLGHIFDVNIETERYDINKRQECLIEVDGVVLLDNLYFQLTSVKKLQKTGSHDEFIEYEAQIRDSSSDFYTLINNKELEDLDFSDYDHIYTISSITQSFNHTYEDGYKYILPYLDFQNNNIYNVRDFKPAIYAKNYFDRIFAESGYSYTWDELNNDDIQFDKLIIPFNGDKPNPFDSPEFKVEVEKTTSVDYTFTSTNISPWYQFIAQSLEIDTIVSDPSNLWGLTSATYQTPSPIIPDDYLELVFDVDYDLILVNPHPDSISLNLKTVNDENPLNYYTEYIKFVTFNFTNLSSSINNSSSEIGRPIIIQFGTSIPANDSVVIASNIKDRLTIKHTSINTNNLIKPYITHYNNYANSSYFWTTGSVLRRPDVRIRINSVNIKIQPKVDTFVPGAKINVNSFIPKKIKQSDFIKSIFQMYNIYLDVDENDKKNLILKNRDLYYDSGGLKNWTEKIIKELQQDIKFIPEIQSKSLLLTYKQDSDTPNKLYQDTTRDIYGQIRIIFDNDYVRDEKKQELLFSPTPIGKTDFNAIVPLINGQAPKTNLRILLDNGVRSCGLYSILQSSIFEEDTINQNVTLNYYPLISHFNDDFNPTFDINYGTCRFYFYELNRLTQNNLYNLHWRRTMSQINNGKILSANFILNSNDIRDLKLNDKIRIDNSYWFINKIVDFDPSNNKPTFVELISIEDDLTLLEPTVIGNVITETNGAIINNYGIGDNLLNSDNYYGLPGLSRNRSSYTNLNTGGNTRINGNGNNVTRTAEGEVWGDYNTVNSTGLSQVYGDRNTLLSSSYIYGDFNIVETGLENVFLFTSEYTATQSNIIVTPQNLVLDGPNPTINGQSITNIIGLWEEGDGSYSIQQIGDGSSIAIGNWALVFGQDNTIDDSNNCVVLGGQDNTIYKDVYSSSIIGGNNNIIDKDVYSSSIIGGNNNTINEAYSSLILSGDNNTITNHALGIILGGSNNQVDNGSRSGIFTGQNNEIDFSSWSSIISGQNNILKDSINSVIIGGVDNTIDNVQECTSISGNYNIIQNCLNSSILCGTDNELLNTTSSAIIGVSIKTGTRSQTTYTGDLEQKGIHTVQTTDATTTNIFTFVPVPDGVYTYTAKVTGFEVSTGDAIGVDVFAVFNVISQVVTQVGVTSLDRKSNFPGIVTVVLNTDGTNIRLRVTGQAGKTINWRASTNITL
jgi:hypothetical protein